MRFTIKKDEKRGFAVWDTHRRAFPDGKFYSSGSDQKLHEDLRNYQRSEELKKISMDIVAKNGLI